LIPKLAVPAPQFPPLEPPLAPPPAVVIFPADPKPPLPAVQLDAPLLAPAGLAAVEVDAASVRDEFVLVLSWVPVCCICAIPAQGKTIAARIAIKNALPVFAPLMV
jgi:hypothetical protein